MTAHKARVALIGLGPIGIEVGKALAGRPEVELLGAADPAPDKAGRPLSGMLDGAFPGVDVTDSAAALYRQSASKRAKTDVAVLCTGSRLHSMLPQIEEAIDAGMHIVSTCEELSYPELRHHPMAVRIDQRAKAKGVAVLGTGVNPGLVMDRLVLAVASACVSVKTVRVTRVVDAARRRGPLRAKVGAGLSRAEFDAGVAAKKLGHVGLSESAAIIALGLGLPIDEITETIKPVIAETETEGVPPGRVLGLHQVALVQGGDEPKVVLDLTMAVGAPNPADRIDVDGDPPLHVVAEGGFHGDRSTIGTVVNAIPFIVSAPPGLQNVVTIPLFGLQPLA
ncbi:MAG TPA: dihydrodipicolinate reductase [Thermoanaerobaculia bacterium]|jgi:4-hydroxy-tetrahydrodipicolinate reductase|nr:dihydrodipicolinate reductase [Thermoanaerobaculia bacterium]